MNFVYSSTRNFYPYMRWSIESLLEHNKVTKIYILAEDDEVPIDIPCPHEVINYSGQQYFGSDCPNLEPWPIVSLIYAVIPELVRANKVIYLDQDTVICENLKPMWDIDLKGKWGAWCPERTGVWKPYGPMYYNSGVAVMNLAQMRKDKVAQQLVEMLNGERFRFSTQDALNKIITPEKVVDLDSRYNESFCCGYTDNPAIVHFAGYPDWYESKTMPRWEYLARYSG